MLIGGQRSKGIKETYFLLAWSVLESAQSSCCDIPLSLPLLPQLWTTVSVSSKLIPAIQIYICCWDEFSSLSKIKV